jgi:uncharacterized RDD family membrane protein YckC
MSEQNSSAGRFAPPQAQVADIAVDGIELGGRGTRLAAVIVDGVLMGLLLWLVSKVTPWNAFAPDMSGGLFLALAKNLVIGCVAFVLVNGYLLVTQGQTVGKRLLGLRIVRPDGERASAARVLGARYGIGYAIGVVPFVGGLFGLIDMLLIFRESRQCLHDNIADTIVVKA